MENIDKTWKFDYQGATGTFTLGSDQTSDALTALESARASVNGTTYTFVPVELDNTNGSTSLNMYGITVVTKDGQQVDSTSLQDVFSSWRDAAGDDVDKYNAIVDLSNEYGQFDLQPGAKGHRGRRVRAADHVSVACDRHAGWWVGRWKQSRSSDTNHGHAPPPLREVGRIMSST